MSAINNISTIIVSFEILDVTDLFFFQQSQYLCVWVRQLGFSKAGASHSSLAENFVVVLL